MGAIGQLFAGLAASGMRRKVAADVREVMTSGLREQFAHGTLRLGGRPATLLGVDREGHAYVMVGKQTYRLEIDVKAHLEETEETTR